MAHPEVQCNQSFLFDRVAILPLLGCSFRWYTKKCSVPQIFLFDTVAMFNIAWLYFKMAHQQVQCAQIFLFYMMENLISLLYILYVTLLLTGCITLKRRVKP